eukprot:CFRG7270T1
MRQTLVALASRHTGAQVRNLRKERSIMEMAELRRKNQRTAGPKSKYFTIDRYETELKAAMKKDHKEALMTEQKS